MSEVSVCSVQEATTIVASETGARAGKETESRTKRPVSVRQRS